MNLGKRVKDLRTLKGISQELLAEESGLSLRTVQRIENNETVPRGDSVKRIARALDSTPDDIIEWTLQEDQNYLTLMNLSALGFLVFPILGIIIPMALWIYKKDKLKYVNELGKSLLNFQITWTLILFLYYIVTIVGIFGNATFEFNAFIMPLIVLYAYNMFITVFNTITIYKHKSFKYYPALRLLK